MKKYFASKYLRSKNFTPMTKKLLLVATTIIVALNSFSQVLSYQTVKSASFDYSKLALIDAEVNKYVQNHWLVGSTVIIVKDNKVVYHKGFGYANEASKTPMYENAIYRIMSQTKAITSLAIMQLYERGKINLDQKVSDFIPSFKNQPF